MSGKREWITLYLFVGTEDVHWVFDTLAGKLEDEDVVLLGVVTLLNPVDHYLCDLPVSRHAKQ